MEPFLIGPRRERVTSGSVRQRSRGPELNALRIVLTFSVLVLTCTAQQPAPDDSQFASIDGTVINSITKEPVKKALVSLAEAEGAHDSALVATTDEAGHFRFADLKPDRYRLTVEKDGFVDGTYGALQSSDAGSFLRLNTGDRLHDVTLRLFPGGSISGRILDTDGEPLAASEVKLWGRSGKSLTPYDAGETTTNRAGDYRFDGLSPGTYYVSANPSSLDYGTKRTHVDSSGKPTKLRPLITFYPAVFSFAEAQALHVEPGSEQSGIDIRIQRGSMLSVSGKIAGLADSPSKYSLSASEEVSGASVARAEILPGGEFVFPSLAPGAHELNLSENTVNGRVLRGQAEVILMDQDVTGVTILPFGPAQVRVRVVKEGEEEKPFITGQLRLKRIETNDRFRSIELGSEVQNGAYILNSVRPGRYRVSFFGLPDCYLKSVQSGVQRLNPDSIEVQDSAVLDLLLTYSPGTASLSGDIEVPQQPTDDSAQPQYPIEVVLIADGKLPAWDESRSITPDQTLHFSLPHVAPGKYLAFATQDSDSDLWNNSDALKALQSQGVEIELHEKDAATIHLKLVPKDDTDRIRRQLGL